MKIVIAAWHLRNFNVGLGRYARELIEALGRVDRDNRYVILMPDTGHRFSARPNMTYRVIRFPFFKRRFWEQMAPQLAGSYDVLHFPYDSSIGWKRGKFVATVHDVKPLVFGNPERRPNLNERLEGWFVGDRWTKMDHVVTDSLWSQRDIVARLRLAPERVTVVYPGVDTDQFRPSPTEPRSSAQRPYVFCVAGADPTKNVETLIAAFSRLPQGIRGTHDLILAGDVVKRTELRDQVRREGLEAQVRFLGLIDDRRLVTLYQEARLFAFPSRYEGFGLPVLEAMACGCPVVSSNASSLPEVMGEAGVLVDPSDVGALTNAMAGVLCDDRHRETLALRGLAQAKRFSWDDTGRGMVQVYRRVLAVA